MMSSAPGKLFILGEYAVLAGGWSLVCAVDRRVHVRALDAPTGYRVTGTSARHSDALPRAAMRHAGFAPERIDSFEVHVGELYHEGKKLGLGSSAASTAALLAATVPGASPEERFVIGFQAHRDIQHGRGSGGDVAASSLTGTLAYRLSSPQAPFPACAVEPLEGAQDVGGVATIKRLKNLGQLVDVRAIWTGLPASSTDFIARVEDALGEKGAQAHLERLSDLAYQGICALERADAPAFLAQIERANLAMRALGVLCNAPICTPLHDRLSLFAANNGLVAKPSGAGGGDFSLLFAPRGVIDWEQLLEFLPAGCVHIPMQLGAQD